MSSAVLLVAYFQKGEKVDHMTEQTSEMNLECTVQDHIPSGKREFKHKTYPCEIKIN